MANGNFQNCLPLTLREEGGYANDVGDPGGATENGITHATYDAYRASNGLPSQDVRLMTVAERDDIYLGGYWNAIGAEALPAGVDLSGFDYGVNSGPKKARFELAKATQAAADPAAIIEQIANDRLSFLHALPTWSRFGPGWGPRVARIEAASLKMAGASLPAAASSARAKAASAKKKAIGSGAVSSIAASAASGLSPEIAHGGWILLGVVAAALTIVGIHAFNVWRQSQRASTLDQAIAAMQEEATAVAKARDAVAAQQTATAKNIAAEQASLARADVAKAAAAAVMQNQPSQPPQVHR